MRLSKILEGLDTYVSIKELTTTLLPKRGLAVTLDVEVSLYIEVQD